jgi:hypothetical protein
MYALKRNPLLVPDHKVMDGINAARLILPRCYFDREACEAGLEALRQYAAEYDEKMRAFKDNPRPTHWSNHAADAFRYVCMAWREMAQPAPAPAKPTHVPVPKLTVNTLLKAAQRERRWE